MLKRSLAALNAVSLFILKILENKLLIRLLVPLNIIEPVKVELFDNDVVNLVSA